MGKFLTPIENFDHRPFVVAGRIQTDLVINQNWIFWLDEESGLVHGVPPGFVNNLASRPPMAEFYIRKLGRTQRPAAIHDLFYVLRVKSKRWSDIQYFKASEADGVELHRNWVMRAVLTTLGWWAWWSRDEFVVIGADGRRLRDAALIARFEAWARGLPLAEARRQPEFILAVPPGT